MVICNAGVMEIPTLEQVRGIEKHFVTNHLGHFLLVNRLLPQITSAPQGRVVVVSSGSSYRDAPAAGIEFDNLSGERGYEPRKAYGQSKLANVLFARELARRLAGVTATANSLQPGVIMTNLGRYLPWYQLLAARLFGWAFMKSVGEGAATQVYVATYPGLAGVSGHFFRDCNPVVPGGHLQNDAMAAQLWQVSEELVRPWLA
jgi:WW domain-containing oxidoreductase